MKGTVSSLALENQELQYLRSKDQQKISLLDATVEKVSTVLEKRTQRWVEHSERQQEKLREVMQTSEVKLLKTSRQYENKISVSTKKFLMHLPAMFY